jgi:uncharacterized protein
MKLEYKNTFWLFLVLTTVHMMTVAWGFFDHAVTTYTLDLTLFFNVLALISYSFIYVSVILLPIYLVCSVFKLNLKLTATLSIILSTIALLFIGADLMIYDLYNFHFNGFVWNLITTRGGVSSLGGGNDTYFSIALTALLTLAIQAALWFVSRVLVKNKTFKLRWKILAWLFFPMFLTQGIVYGFSDVKNYGAVLMSAQSYPFYIRVKFKGAAKKYLGIESVRQVSSKLTIDTSRINYPLHPIEFSHVDKPMNVVFLVSESLRWDRLTPEIMPNTWNLAQKGQFYKNHYSSGNGTREGLFGMFYGLYGSYWSSFLYAQQSPLLINRMIDLGYQFDIRTSAKFSYPEFNKTLFTKIPLAKLHEESDSKKPWQRDEDNTTALVDFIQNRDKTKPFMSFFFFESTHARYDFPDSSIIAKPYLKDVNYWGMSRKSLAPKINEFKNRYTNAAHWIDIQLGRIYNKLEKEGLLENTIIIVTGDHGEEFLEKGFWGHNSSFVEEQTHVPMVMWIPNKPHQELTQVTSHMDIGTTLLQKLGAPEDTESYSLGKNMLKPLDRKFIVVSDWHSISVMTNDMKYRIPYASKGFESWQPTGQKDELLTPDQASQLMRENQPEILEAIKNSSKFLIKNQK